METGMGTAHESIRVVVADDAAELREALVEVLEDYGSFEIVGEAEDGGGAVELVRSVRPDLLLIDLAMPRMDGMEAIPHVLRSSPETKIAVLSGFQASLVEKDVMERGAHLYITKGTHPDQIVEQLLQLCSA